MKARNRMHHATAFLTIVSRNYVPTARILARSLAKHEPESVLHIITIDPDLADDFVDFPNVRLSSIDQIGLPDFGCFTLKYDVVELCTAVKPFAIAHLMDMGLAKTIVYLDPDIVVMSALDELHQALSEYSIVLTPHLLGASDDQAKPRELDILRAGTYNLGFIGVRSDYAGRALLEWWRERLFDRCVNDPDRGLFVDQRWMDLAPGLFEGVHILRDPGYNVAYWNLHERPLQMGGGGYTVGGKPLRFFHFSGYSPVERTILSRHQTRLHAQDHPRLQALLDSHAEDLLAAGFREFNALPYRFGALSNGVKASAALRLALRELIERGLDFPDPVTDADGFCRCLLQPIFSSKNGPVVPLKWAVEQLKIQPPAGFGPVDQSSESDPFINWCRSGDGIAHGLATLASRFGGALQAESELQAVLDYIDDTEPLHQMPGLVLDRSAFQRLVYWARAVGAMRGRWSDAGPQALDALWPQMRRLFNRCVTEPLALELMKEPTGRAGEPLQAWLLGHFDEIGVSPPAIQLFCAAVRQQPQWFSDIAVFADPLQGIWPGVFDLATPVGQGLHRRQLERRTRLLLQKGPPLSAQFEIWRSNLAALPLGMRARLAGLSDLALPLLDAASALEAQALMRTPPRIAPHQNRLNLAGHHGAPTGMGELARSLRRSCEAAGFDVAPVVLPTLRDDEPLGPHPFTFGVAAPYAELSITAVNADRVDHAIETLPVHYWAARNIGYWIWETERLPGRYRDVAKTYDEIWTASESARDAIAQATDRPVQVLPLALDLDAMDRAKADRARFGIPEDAVSFGYFFDFDSGLERKNPLGLIEAFKAAFGDDPGAVLVLKVHGRIPHTYATRRVWDAAAQSNIRILTSVRSRQDTLDLQASLDAYVSLNRAEGFGLTCAEAMALGKPVIATDYSGNRDFMDADCALMVPAEIKPTVRAWGPYPPGSLWASPDLSVAAGMMRHLMDASERQRIGGLGKGRVRRQLSPQAVGVQLRALLDA